MNRLRATRWIVFGAGGQLGSEVVREARALGLDVDAVGRADVDAAQPADVAARVEAFRPDVVVNSVAFTNVDAAEERPQEAFAANAVAASAIARAATRAGARLLHMSTSYVFDGTSREPYVEGDVPAPRSVYGASKLAGEHLVRAAHPAATIVRLVSLFGAAGSRSKEAGNFVEAFARRAQGTEPVRVVADQRVAPTHTRDVARALLDIARSSDPPRLLHLASEGSATWHEVAVHVARRVGGDAPIEPISTADHPYKAPRLANATMDTGLARKTLGRALPGWRDAVDAYLRVRGLA